MIDDSSDEWGLRSDNRQIDAFVHSERRKCLDIIGRDGHVANLFFAGRAGIAGRYQDFVDISRLSTFPCERVFAAAVADYQDFHRLISVGRLWLLLVSEVSHPREDHRETMFVRGLNNLVVAH